MKKAGLGMVLLLSAAVLSSCAKGTNEEAPGGSMAVSSVFSETDTGEVDSMRREFCKVESIQDENFILKNTKEETYLVDISFLKGLKVGDQVLLIYRERTQTGEKEYSADVYAVYPDNDSLLELAH